LPDPASDEPVYLERDDILELYAAIIDASATQAAEQLRDSSGLEGALAEPIAHAHYEQADLAMQAAVLAHGIAEGQFFIDGNKGLALVAMLTFLDSTATASTPPTPTSPAGSSTSPRAQHPPNSPRASAPRSHQRFHPEPRTT
jgi:death-on-curing protein